MKKNLLLFMLLLTATVSALTVGRDGESYTKDQVVWQPVKYDNSDSGFKAVIPGSPTSGISNGEAYVYSKYNGVEYEVHTSINGLYNTPKTLNEFMGQVYSAFSDVAEAFPVPTDKKNIKYIADIYYYKENKIVRLIASKNKLYFALVIGDDQKLATEFFDSIEIIK